MITLHWLLSLLLLPVAWTQGPKIKLESSQYSVEESDGSVEVCATVSGGTLSSSVVVTIITLPSTATSPEDYTSLSQDHTFTPGGSTRRCSTIQISPDDAVESSETFSAGLQSMVDILGTPSNAFILVLDSSTITLRLSAAEYFVFESLRLTVCVELVSGRTEREVTYEIIPGGGSASTLSDYSNNPILDSFVQGSSPGDEKCRKIVTFSDRNVENDETFILELRSSDTVTVTDGMAIATIQDNDHVEVSWQQSEVSVVEGGNGAVMQAQLCLVLEDIAGGVHRLVNFHLSSMTGTADESDYLPLSDVILGFPADPSLPEGSTVCQTVNIIGDVIMEDDETFTVVATPENDEDVFIGSPIATITILDDGDSQVACPALTDPVNGVVSLSGVTQGSTATYTCNIGFTISGALTRTCGSSGAWLQPEPSCQIIDCGQPPSPANASPVSTVTATVFGVEVTYVCELGYLPEGEATISCGQSGSWSGPGPQCNAVDCGQLSNPLNGVVQVPQEVYPGVATYSCNTGHILIGGSTRNCQPNAMWSGTPPICEVVTCPVLQNPTNGNVQHPSGVEYLSTAQYTCNFGFTESSGDGERTCQANGAWSGTELICLAVNCGLLSPPENGDVMHSGTTFNQMAEYSCNTGYELSESTPRTCLSTGMWSGSSPTCIRVGCGPLSDPSNGQVEVSDFLFGSEAHYTCTAGCPPVGDSTRECQAVGQWSGATPQCPVVNCGTLSNPSNGVVQFLSSSSAGGDVMYVCDPGYELVGNSGRECLCSSQWSGSEPVCQAVDCGSLEAPADGSVSTSQGTEFSSVATYTCNEGYQLVGPQMRSCQANRQWSGTAPSCQIVTCPVLQGITRGSISLSRGMEFGSVATYSCEEGYRVEGDMERTCLATGAWSGTSPVCQEIICESLDDPTNGRIVFYSDGFLFDSVAIFTCDPGFNLIGSDRRRCQGLGEWSSQSPQCIEIECGPLSSPGNGNVVVEGSGLGAVATYSCDTGYNIGGQSTRTCQNSGNPAWSGRSPTCNIVTCSILPNPANGVVQYISGQTYQSRADFSCQTGYQLTGPPSLTCQADGEWSDTPPLCEFVVCPDLTPPENGAITYTQQPPVYQSSADYDCGSGYILDGVTSRMCTSDGTWSGNSAICRPVDCGELDDPEDGSVQFAKTTFGGIALYECNEDYMLTPPQSTRICQADGNWSGFAPTCELVDCGRPPFVFFSTSTTLATIVGTTITYNCFTGRRLVGDRQRTCQSNGQWSGDTPECVVVFCDDLSPPLNGIVSITSLQHGGTAEYGCEQGYQLEGAPTRVCEGEGTWSGTAPICQIVSCPSLSDPMNGQVQQQSLQYQSTASYTCHEGYLLVGGSERMCLDSGVWSGEEPGCDPVDCGPLLPPANGEVMTDTTVLGAQATYSCVGSGYLLVGDSSRQCSTTGRWTGSQPVCENINECESMNGMCEQLCQDREGSYDCLCHNGYKVSAENTLMCVDVNECDDGNNGGCDHECSNTVGGLICACDEGYLLSGNGKNCIDMNECVLGLDNCHSDASCTNIGGSFKCTCDIGFEGNGTSCINTDECAQSGSPCQENAVCTDIEGGFVCQCLPGFEEGPETTCINVDECVTGNNCHPNATCTDTDGSYTCTCKEGNAGDGFTCEAQCVTTFQLVLGPVDSCLNWRFDSTTAKLSDITFAAVRHLQSTCDCSFSERHISENEFACFHNDAQEVIYRAKLQGVEANDCFNLTSNIREWVDEESSILIQGNRLKLNPTCDLEIETLDIAPACIIGDTPPNPTTTTSSNGGLSIELIIGGASAGFVIIVLLFALVLVVCCICCRRSKKGKRESEPNDYNTLSRPFSQTRHPMAASGSFSHSPTSGRGIFDYTTDVDTKASSTFEPGNMSRTPSIPLVHMADIKRISGRSSRSGSFSSIDPNDMTYANISDNNREIEKFDDPVYEQIKGDKEDFAHNPLYDGTMSTSL